MNEARVIGAGLAEHPESGKRLLRVTVDKEWAVAGETYPYTYIWAHPQMPLPRTGDPIEWDLHHVYFDGRTWPKPEYDSNPGAPLH